MENNQGITLEKALKMLEAANSIIQSQQKEISDQQLKIDAQATVIVSKDSQLKKKDLEIKAKQKEIELREFEIEQKNLQIIQLQKKLATQLRYRFCARTEKSDNQPNLFDFEDEAFIPSELLAGKMAVVIAIGKNFASPRILNLA